MNTELFYGIALTLVDHVGDINAKSLLAYCGSAEAVFKERKGHLLKIPGIGAFTADSIISGKDVFRRAEQELHFVEKHGISALLSTNPLFPRRLKHCPDSPVMLYYKGAADLNCQRIVAVVGTRRPSDYGKEKTIELINGLAGSGILVLSGLAYGIDILAHKASLDVGLSTVGVLAHGLDRIYPQQHTKIAHKMIEEGGLLTEFMSQTQPDAVNFPRRNRIVAGLCDALVVIESGRTGGSLITATIANSYNKDVFAIPGLAGSTLAEGTNGLIKRNRAALIENTHDLLDAMQWGAADRPQNKPAQIPLAIQLSGEEQKIMDALGDGAQLHLDQLSARVEMPVSKVSAILLQLEFNNLVKNHPGKLFELV